MASRGTAQRDDLLWINSQITRMRLNPTHRRASVRGAIFRRTSETAAGPVIGSHPHEPFAGGPLCPSNASLGRARTPSATKKADQAGPLIGFGPARRLYYMKPQLGRSHLAKDKWLASGKGQRCYLRLLCHRPVFGRPLHCRRCPVGSPKGSLGSRFRSGARGRRRTGLGTLADFGIRGVQCQPAKRHGDDGTDWGGSGICYHWSTVSANLMSGCPACEFPAAGLGQVKVIHHSEQCLPFMALPRDKTAA